MKNLFKEVLEKTQKDNLYRKLQSTTCIGEVEVVQSGKKLISFACNDYLSLSQNKKVKKVAIDAIKKYGVGGRSSRYITGNNELYEILEKQIAALKNCDDAIIFSSGYACAVGVVPAIVGEGDLIIADRLIHSSLIDAAKLSGARFTRFAHNSISACEEILKSNRDKFKKCLIVTETVFSMDGDLGKMQELLDLAEKYNCLLLSDDAHGLGVIDSLKENNPRHLQIGTFSKAVGALGGYVCAEKILIDYLRNFAKTVIYSTALPPAILAACSESLKIISKKELQEKLMKNVHYFCKLMNLNPSESAIVVIIIGDNFKVLEIANYVKENGFIISGIRPPTVPDGTARLRITFSVSHKKKQIEDLVRVIHCALKASKIS